MAVPIPIPYAVLRSGDMELINIWQQLVDEISDLNDGNILSDYLTSVNTLNLSANEFVYADGTNSAAKATLTAVGRTFLAAATAAAQRQAIDLPGTLTSGDLWYASGGSMTALAQGTTNYILKQGASGPSWAASGGGGLALEATATADGTSESLQVTATTTPSNIKRMILFLRSFVPEVDGDDIFVTCILDDDTELTASVYDWIFWQSVTTTFTEGTANFTSFNMTPMGNASGEYNSQKVELISDNGSQTVKQLEQTAIMMTNTPAQKAFRRYITVTTSNMIKGFRVDTDNTGDMINEGRAELWVQTA